MEIDFEYAYRAEELEGLELEKLALLVLQREECDESTEVCVSFIDDARMAEMNAEFRGKEGPTDVLSFECDGLDDEMGDLELDGMPYELGDVIIAPDVAERQCAGFGNTLEQEIDLLLVHGLLHLCGYDHIEDEEADIMEARETELLRAWGAVHPSAAGADASLIHGAH